MLPMREPKARVRGVPDREPPKVRLLRNKGALGARVHQEGVREAQELKPGGRPEGLEPAKLEGEDAGPEAKPQPTRVTRPRQAGLRHQQDQKQIATTGTKPVTIPSNP